MTKNEYLARLKSCLECIDASEREAAVQFYTEYFEDAGEENAEKVMAELGSPRKACAGHNQAKRGQRTHLPRRRNSGLRRSIHRHTCRDRERKAYTAARQ